VVKKLRGTLKLENAGTDAVKVRRAA